MENILSMAALEAAIQSNKLWCMWPLDGRIKPAHGEVSV